MAISTRKASLADLSSLIDMLDGYRVFYEQTSNKKAARLFLENRFRKGDSEIFIAESDGTPAGFVQLYPSYSTVSLRSVYILNDLYTLPTFRGKGVGTALLKRAQEFCTEKESKGLALETAIDNPAQALYERLGWEKDIHCFHYFWTAS